MWCLARIVSAKLQARGVPPVEAALAAQIAVEQAHRDAIDIFGSRAGARLHLERAADIALRSLREGHA